MKQKMKAQILYKPEDMKLEKVRQGKGAFAESLSCAIHSIQKLGVSIPSSRTGKRNRHSKKEGRESSEDLGETRKLKGEEV